MITPDEPPAQPEPAFTVVELTGPPPPLDLEFKPNELSEIFGKAGLSLGRCFGSKSGYMRFNPRAEFIPNANIFCRLHGKIWWGDLDLHSDQPALEKVAHRLRCRLYVLREYDGRFDNAEIPHETVISRAQWHTSGWIPIAGLARIHRRSGLTLAQLAKLANIRRTRLTGRQPPKIALAAQRRLVEFDELFGEIATELGYKKWGQWWTTPKDSLGGQTPLAAISTGRSVSVGTLMDGRSDDHVFRFAMLAMTILGKPI